MALVPLHEQIGVEETGPGTYVSSALPIRMGNQLPIAYGGCTISIAVHAAIRSVKPTFHLYSAVGHFLGPALTDRKLECRVRPLRDTRTFATRQIEVMQTLATGETRVCLAMLADFQVDEPSMYHYSLPPSMKYRPATECPTNDEMAEGLIARGYLSEQVAKVYAVTSRPLVSLFDMRQCPEGVSGQNLGGVAKAAPTSQDHLPITSKVSADWFCSRDRMSSTGENLAALAFMMDASLSFMPLVHDHKFLQDAGACSTLDFALRIFVNGIDISDWHLRERATQKGDAARTYTEAKLWNNKGELVASMTQQSIMRPLPPPKPLL